MQNQQRNQYPSSYGIPEHRSEKVIHAKGSYQSKYEQKMPSQNRGQSDYETLDYNSFNSKLNDLLK